MRFLCLYKSAKPEGTPPAEKEMAEMGKLIEDWMKSGKLLATEGCLPSALGARVRLSKGKFNVVDGPFTESKEAVAGYILLRVTDLDAATEVAKECPGLDFGMSVEIRPISEELGRGPD